MTIESHPDALQRRLDDLLAAARSAEKQLDNIGAALAALDPKALRAAGLPTVNYHDLLDARSRLGEAVRGVRGVQEIARKRGAQR